MREGCFFLWVKEKRTHILTWINAHVAHSKKYRKFCKSTPANTNDVTISLQDACSIAEDCTCPRCKCQDLRESAACKQMEDSNPDGAAMTFVPAAKE